MSRSHNSRRSLHAHSALLAVFALSLCASTARAAAYVPGTAIGATGDGKPDYVYNADTGDLTFQLDGATFLTTRGLPSFVDALYLKSGSGQFFAANTSAAFNSGLGLTRTPTELAVARDTSPGYTDGTDI